VSGTFNVGLELPDWLELVVGALPIKALTDGLRAAYDPAVASWPVGDLAVLAVWGAIGVVLAHRYFRWEPS
jgi:ABC-2 type transport system permease protein